jgi:hypothetical protein
MAANRIRYGILLSAYVATDDWQQPVPTRSYRRIQSFPQFDTTLFCHRGQRFLRPIQSNPATGSISSLRLEDRTSGYCANLAITIRSTNPSLAGRGATDILMDERAEFVERRGSPSLTPR